ncbi:MAG: ribonuclease HII [Candidatus Pacearchaeota archaeon]
MKIIGIDDAGRGPVIGPMILAGVLIEEKDKKILKEWGAKDSKLLTPKKRKEIGDKIKKKFKSHIEVTYPKEIDESDNLNYLEAIKAAKIINKLTESISEPIDVIVDCPSVNLSSWGRDVSKLLKKPEIIKMYCEHKADVNHLVVSAASIIAKEKREEEIARLKKELEVDFGSGYPSDPKTKEFIRGNHNNSKYSHTIRFSWETIIRIVKKDRQSKLFDNP